MLVEVILKTYPPRIRILLNLSDKQLSKISGSGRQCIMLPPTQLLISFPHLSGSCWGLWRTKGEMWCGLLLSCSLRVKELLSLYNPPYPNSSGALALSRNKREGWGGWYLAQKQSRGKQLVSDPSLLTSVQALPLPISPMNKISCKSSEVNYRTEDWGGHIFIKRGLPWTCASLLSNPLIAILAPPK